uniref:Uncharacterized protein n=1 Tax=Triticum urartu TaxID=4572 RepID=A0A8R7TB38_TRIUA
MMPLLLSVADLTKLKYPPKITGYM